ncbi:NAD(P)-binding protein [Tilletiopsis washingtonensis]|uniref:NAD(P)-binding protein n=1 Tax=Tilletiopsis washingtonensis TaxID=58919 RepID=A0A316ZC29_9BASI|nr:NAD(P)-binding protein [Tilletiopsis washingtonensis]PWN99337.1 NAD(P)-binding protein [Tilletiopsis washingtonensis]
MHAYIMDADIKQLSELPGKLRRDAPAPSVDADGTEVLVDVYSASLNLFDQLQVRGKYQIKKPFPYIPGTEIAGVISANSPIPDGCNWVPGKTRVFGSANGSYAEQVVAESSSLQEIPEGMSFEEASGLYVTWPTSYAALRFRANVQPGEWVLIHAGAGGVGLCAIQIAKALGAKVIATAGSDEKLKVCTEVGGADHAVNYRDKEWFKKVKEITEDHGVDVVYDPVGMILPSLKCIAWNGRILVIGFAAGDIEKVPANLVLLKQCTLMGVFWGLNTVKDPEQVPKVWDGIMELLTSKKAKAVVYKKVYDGLDQLTPALEALMARETWGKVVLRVRADPQNPPKGKSNL